LNNDDIVAKRNQAITEANQVYNKIINDQTNLVTSQSQQIDNYLKNSESAINQSINNNVSALNNSVETSKRQHEVEKQAIMNNYNNSINNVDESVRIGMMNSARNRISTSESSLNDVVQEYNNQIAQAKITGQSMLAQQALEMLKEKLNLQTIGIDNVNNMLIANQNNTQQLTKDYGNIDNKYSKANNNYLDRKQDIDQFNKEIAYKNQQLNNQKKLKEQEYKLDLRDARNAYYRRRAAASSGGVALTDTSKSASQTSSGNDKYYANYTPVGLTSEAKKVYDNLTKSVLSNGYVTASQIANSIKGLPDKQQTIIGSAFKQGTTNPVKKNNSSTKTSKSVPQKPVVSKPNNKGGYKKITYKKYLK